MESNLYSIASLNDLPIKFDQKKLIAFDIDGTLSRSRSKIDSEMAVLLKELLQTKQVAIISGEAFVDIGEQVLNEIGLNNEINKNLTLLPTNGGGLYTFDGKWNEIFSHKLTIEEKEKIIKAMKEVDAEDDELKNNISYGIEIQDRDSEITYAALGARAPIKLKEAWDPNFKKRIILQEKLMKKLPEFEVKIGGKTSIDITPKGMDKAYGINELMDYFKFNKEDIIFVGDSVYENGNDFPVYLMGIDTIKVADPEGTKLVIKKILEKK